MVQIEAILNLLECKLVSIPSDPIPESEVRRNPVGAPADGSTSVAQGANGEEKKADQKAKEAGPKAEKERLRAELYEDPQVKKFAQMLKFGVHEQAILGKIKALGYPDDLLEVFNLFIIRELLQSKENLKFQDNYLIYS